MTDYEEDFVGFREWPGALPINRLDRLQAVNPEALWPQSDALAAWEEKEKPPVYGTSQTVIETVKDYYYPGEPEEIDYYGKEGDDDEDYGDEDEEGEGEEEGGEEDYGEEDYGEEEVWPPPEYK